MKQKIRVLFHFSGKGAGAQLGVHEKEGRKQPKGEEGDRAMCNRITYSVAAKDP